MRAFLISLIIAFFNLSISAQVVFETEYFSHSDVNVFVSQNRDIADLLVYKVDRPDAAGENNGVWYFTENKDEAVRKIYFVKYTNRADLIIYFVDNKSQAGWKNEGKKYLMF